jgi:formiminotetrahydrofolate cyclodeaminase
MPSAELPDLVEELWADGATPGGGATSAASLAMAADLVAGLARRSADWEEGPAAAAQAAALRRRAASLARENTATFATAMAALRPAAGAPVGQGRLRPALEAAADVPLRVAQLGADVAHLARHVGRFGDQDGRVDAMVAADIAAACATGAARLVEVNLAVLEGDARLVRARAAADAARREAAAAA